MRTDGQGQKQYPSAWLHHNSLVGGGGSVLAVVVPGGVLVQHLGPVWRPRHDIQPVASLQRVLAPRPRLMLRLQERGGRLDAEQRAGAHENWEGETARCDKVEKEGARRRARREAGEREKSGQKLKASAERREKNGLMHELDAFDAQREKKKDEERKREGFKTPALVSRGKQQKTYKC